MKRTLDQSESNKKRKRTQINSYLSVAPESTNSSERPIYRILCSPSEDDLNELIKLKTEGIHVESDVFPAEFFEMVRETLKNPSIPHKQYVIMLLLITIPKFFKEIKKIEDQFNPKRMNRFMSMMKRRMDNFLFGLHTDIGNCFDLKREELQDLKYMRGIGWLMHKVRSDYTVL